ncbi:MAG: RluA family pseudouridine synthase [Patescibacteria group bacterium]
MDVKIIFEDDQILVLDKPAGMIVNRSDTTKGETTLQDWVDDKFNVTGPAAHHLAGAHSANKPLRASKVSDSRHPSEDDFVFRSGIVHRLDKETSGIILAAKTIPAFINLQTQFKERKVQKTYIALAHGKIETEKGEINVAVGRLPWNRKRFGVLAGGRESVTMYKVIKNLQLTINHEQLTLVELYPKSGRTHQIRVHLQYIHHPIFSDPLYAGRKTSRNDRKLLPRVFLHAAKISFFHPVNGELLSFETPLPDELADFINHLSTE